MPVDTYRHSEGQFIFNTNRGAPVSFEFRAVNGGFFGGRRLRLAPGVNVRFGETFNAQFALDRNDITLPNGPFVTNLVRTRVNYSFSTRMFLQALVQYNDRDQLWSSNVRFGLLSAANTGLFRRLQRHPLLRPRRPLRPPPDPAQRRGPLPHGQVQPGVRPAAVVPQESPW